MILFENFQTYIYENPQKFPKFSGLRPDFQKSSPIVLRNKGGGSG